jgi:hypothetical protein
VVGDNSRALFLEEERRAADADTVAVAEARAGDGLAVDDRVAAEREIFQFESAGHQVDGGMARADELVFEEVDFAIRRAADVRGIAIEDELLAGDQASEDAEPARLGGIFDQGRGECGYDADGDQGYKPADPRRAA